MNDSRHSMHYLEILFVKLHRARRHVTFLKDCVDLKLFPKFSWIPARVLFYTDWSKKRVWEERRKIIIKNLGDWEEKLRINELKFNTVFNEYCLAKSIIEQEKRKLFNNIVSKITKAESQRDNARDNKLS